MPFTVTCRASITAIGVITWVVVGSGGQKVANSASTSFMMARRDLGCFVEGGRGGGRSVCLMRDISKRASMSAMVARSLLSESLTSAFTFPFCSAHSVPGIKAAVPTHRSARFKARGASAAAMVCARSEVAAATSR